MKINRSTNLAALNFPLDYFLSGIWCDDRYLFIYLVMIYIYFIYLVEKWENILLR